MPRLSSRATRRRERGRAATKASGSRGRESARSLGLDGIGVLSPLPARCRARRELRAVADGARGPGQEARIAAVAVLLDRGEQDVLHQILGFVRNHRTARRHPHQGFDRARRERTRGRFRFRRSRAQHVGPYCPARKHRTVSPGAHPSASCTLCRATCDTRSSARCSASCRYRCSLEPRVRILPGAPPGCPTGKSA